MNQTKETMQEKTEVIVEGSFQRFYSRYADMYPYHIRETGSSYVYVTRRIEDLPNNVMLSFVKISDTIICFYEIISLMVDWKHAKKCVTELCMNHNLYLDRHHYGDIMRYIEGKEFNGRTDMINSVDKTYDLKVKPSFTILKSDCTEAKKLITSTIAVVEDDYDNFMSRYESRRCISTDKWHETHKGLELTVDHVEGNPVVVRVTWVDMDGCIVAFYHLVSGIAHYRRMESYLKGFFRVDHVVTSVCWQLVFDSIIKHQNGTNEKSKAKEKVAKKTKIGSSIKSECDKPIYKKSRK